MALNRAVEINHGRGLPGTPLLGHRLSAAAKASCIASSARSKSPRKRIRAARIRPDLEITQGGGLPGPPLLGHRLSAAAKASCIASSARSKSPSKRIRAARIRPESTRYKESSNSRICSVERSDMTTTLANQLPRINLANGGSMQSAQVVTLKSGQQNASSVDAKSPMLSLELRTSSTLPRCSRVVLTSNPDCDLKAIGMIV